MECSKTLRLTRGDLYEKVWSTPIRKLAGEWGLSDVGLAKICERHNIPRPPVGYWAKRQHGKQVRKKALPKVDDDQLNEVIISLGEPAGGPIAVDPEIGDRIRREALPEQKIVVQENSQLRHPFIKATKNALKGGRPDKYGRLNVSFRFAEPHFRVQVAQKSVSRALRILQALVIAMQERGFTLSLSEPRSHEPKFDILGEPFFVSIRESSKQSKIEKDQTKRHHWSYERYEYTPSGILEMCVNYNGYSSDVTLRDTTTKPLETRLNEAIIAMLRTVDRRRQEAEVARQEAIEKARRKQIAVAEEMMRRSDSVRISRLKDLAKAWEEHQRLSALVEFVRQETESRLPEVEPDTMDWLTWADAYLCELDPFSGGEALPTYSLTPAELVRLRRECEADWNGWSGAFKVRSHQ